MRALHGIILTGLVAGLTACGGSDTATTDTASVAATTPAADTMSAAGGMGASGSAQAGTDSLVADVQTAVSAAEGGLTKVPVATAVALVQRIEDRLDATDVPALDDIASDLEKLREELGESTINRGDGGTILVRLGTKTTAVSNDAAVAGSAAAPLQRLGTLLGEQGRALGGR